MSNVLENIVNQKKIDLLNVKKKYTNSLLSSLIKENKSYINFENKITNNIKENKISVIAEIKKASPSAGLIIKQYNPIEIAENYILNGATCLSILTEEKFFLGNLQHITEVKNKFKIPVLCKDFFIDSYQIPLAKSFGADAILIILSGVDNKLAIDLYQTANELNVTSIVEVHTLDEAEKALYFDKAIIGINNRNLKDLKTDIKITLQLHKILSSHACPIISESGIKSEKDVKEIIDKTGIMNFLIGESLLENIEGTSLLKKIVQINQ
jgi:indole-3-glycerol phosphate synthase